jgi:hypothetical protein
MKEGLKLLWGVFIQACKGTPRKYFAPLFVVWTRLGKYLSR